MVVGDALRLSLVSALRGHEAALRRNGIRPSEAFLDLLDTVLECQQGTELVVGWRDPHAGLGVADGDPLVIGMTETASLLGISVRTVKRLVASGAIPSTTVARRRLIDREAVVELARGKERRGG